MLYLIGLGLYDDGDLTLKGVETARNCAKLYIELYTSPWRGSVENLEKLVGRRITPLQRADLEENSDRVISEACKANIAIFVPGDPLVATTHSSLVTDARKRGVRVAIIHSSSVFSAIAETGLQIYKFGRTATVVYPEKNFSPKTPYATLAENLKNGLHTLLLLDVKAEQNRYMTVNEAVALMLGLESKEKKKIFMPSTKCVGVARLGSDTVVKYGKAGELAKTDFGNPPHVLIVPGKMHFSEEEYLRVCEYPTRIHK